MVSVEQKKVVVGALSGIAAMVALIAALYYNLSPVVGMDTVLDRIVFTLRLNVLAALPLFIGLAVIGNARFLSDAIDPLRHHESRSMEIDRRVVGNTLEQNFIFLIGTLALASYLSNETMTLIPALVIVFIIARVAFWIGYHIHPLYRAPGMAATSYMNLGILLSVLYFFFSSIY